MKLLLVALAGFSLMNCTKSALKSPLTVPYHECSQFKGNGLHPNLCFDSLNDSRCPADAICIWAGDAVARFRFTAKSEHQLTLSLSGQMGIGKDTTVEGYHLRLIDVQPFPGLGPAPTTATVEIQ